MIVNNFSKKNSDLGFRLKSTYAELPDVFLTKLSPTPVKKPSLILLNDGLAKDLDLDFSSASEDLIASIFSGNVSCENFNYIAQAYAGHQFGFFTVLGDGRAILLGEQKTTTNKTFDIQLKGSGPTPYSRGGDGRSAMGPVLREYVISEAMHALNIPTTRSLAVVSTGQNVLRDGDLPGAILTRVASSHIRFGTFEYIAMKKDLKNLRVLINYTVQRHYPGLKNKEFSALLLLKEIIEKQASLIVDWMRVGFVHGVMNTDNMAVSGETIDYGPCAFMDNYNLKTVFSSIDHGGRYSYGNQPSIAHWNLVRFAEAILPVIDDDEKKALEMAQTALNDFVTIYKNKWLSMMRRKLGLFSIHREDEGLINRFLSWMEKRGCDFNYSFYCLEDDDLLKKEFVDDPVFENWLVDWKKRLSANKESFEKSKEMMRLNNPFVIPRNSVVEEALNAVYKSEDFGLIKSLISVLKNPYKRRAGIEKYSKPPGKNNGKYVTFCGT